MNVEAHAAHFGVTTPEFLFSLESQPAFLTAGFLSRCPVLCRFHALNQSSVRLRLKTPRLPAHRHFLLPLFSIFRFVRSVVLVAPLMSLEVARRRKANQSVRRCQKVSLASGS